MNRQPHSHRDQLPDRLRRTAHFVGRTSEDVTHHALEPLAATIATAINTIIGWDRDQACSAGYALLDAWTLPLRGPDDSQRRTAYELCARIASHNFPPWPQAERVRYTALLLDRLATDQDASPDLIADLLQTIMQADPPSPVTDCAPRLLQCANAFLGRDPNADIRLHAIIQKATAEPGLTSS